MCYVIYLTTGMRVHGDAGPRLIDGELVMDP